MVVVDQAKPATMGRTISTAGSCWDLVAAPGKIRGVPNPMRHVCLGAKSITDMHLPYARACKWADVLSICLPFFLLSDRCGPMWTDVDRCGPMWTDVTDADRCDRCGPMWPRFTVKSFSNPSSQFLARREKKTSGVRWVSHQIDRS